MPLSDAKLRNIKPTGKRFELPDRDGLVLRVSQRGVLAWAVYFRVRGSGVATGTRVAQIAGNKRRITIGEYPAMGLAAARSEALVVGRTAREGLDPSATKKVASIGPTVQTLFDRYHAEHLQRNLRSGDGVALLLQRHVMPSWSAKPVEGIKRADLIELLAKVREPQTVELRPGAKKPGEVIRGGRGAVVEVRKWTRAMFQFAVDADLLPDNPLIGVKVRERATRRDRVLSMHELKALWNSSETLHPIWCAFFKLLVLTGDRRAEWAEARIEWLAPGNERLEIPAAYYKTGKPQVVPLSVQARQVVASLVPPTNGPYLLSFTAGERPISGFSKAKSRLDANVAAPHSKLAPWWCTIFEGRSQHIWSA